MHRTILATLLVALFLTAACAHTGMGPASTTSQDWTSWENGRFRVHHMQGELVISLQLNAPDAREGREITFGSENGTIFSVPSDMTSPFRTITVSEYGSLPIVKGRYKDSPCYFEGPVLPTGHDVRGYYYMAMTSYHDGVLHILNPEFEECATYLETNSIPYRTDGYRPPTRK